MRFTTGRRPAIAGPQGIRYDRSMITVSRLASLAILIGIVFVTLSPIGFRPQTGHPGLERAAAFLLLGATLGIGFSRWIRHGLVFIVCVAGVLELLQFVDPGRHARLGDMLVKAAAGVIGIALSWLVMRQYRRSTARRVNLR